MVKYLRCMGIALVVASAIFSFSARAHGQDDQKKARRWRVMVIVPETHLYRPHIPDPAVETELSRQLIDAGYKVIDQDRIEQLRYSRVMDRIVQGGDGAKADIIRLGRKFGADILVTGEAFSQMATHQTTSTDVGSVDQIQCRARVELRAVRMDTGEKIFADAIHKTGAPDVTEELASKECLQEAAEDIAPRLLEKLDGLALSNTREIELSIRGVGSQSLASAIEDAIAELPGVQDVSPGDYDAHTDEVEVTIDARYFRRFAGSLETNDHVKNYHFVVQNANGSKITVNCK